MFYQSVSRDFYLGRAPSILIFLDYYDKVIQINKNPSGRGNLREERSVCNAHENKCYKHGCVRLDLGKLFSDDCKRICSQPTVSLVLISVLENK